MNANAKIAVVLLVDDEPNVSEAMKRSLRREPFEFLTASSGKAALELLAAQHIDVVVSDEQMPGMPGSELLALVRRHYPRTIRMILSGQASLEAAVRAINEGEVHRFFIKPCNPIDLSFSVKQAVIHQRLEDQSRRLLREYQKQSTLLARLQPGNMDLMNIATAEPGDENDLDSEVDVKDLLAEIESAIKGP